MSLILSRTSRHLGSTSVLIGVLMRHPEIHIFSLLEDVSDKYVKAIRKHRDSSLKGKMNSYIFKAEDVRELVNDLRQEVSRIKVNFLVRYLYSSFLIQH